MELSDDELIEKYFNETFDESMALAKDHLEKFGEFYPFGCYFDPNGKVTIVGADNGEEHPKSADMIQLLEEGMSSALEKGDAMTTYLVVDVTIPDKWEAPYRDGVRVTINTPNWSAFVYTPYRLKKSGMFKRRRTVEFAEGFLVEPDEAE